MKKLKNFHDKKVIIAIKVIIALKTRLSYHNVEFFFFNKPILNIEFINFINFIFDCILFGNARK